VRVNDIFSFTGLAVVFYPDMVPGGFATPVRVDEAAASPKTLIFMLAVMAILLPVIVIYHSYVASVFSGKSDTQYDT
jgi:cytochrome d ubiquinol oxidase subunit II